MKELRFDNPWPYDDPRVLLVAGVMLGLFFATLYISADQRANGAWMPKLRDVA